MSRCLLAATVVLTSCGTPAAVAVDHRSPGRVHDLPQPLPESSRASSTESRGPHTPTQGRSSTTSPTAAPPAHTTTNRGTARPNLAALRQCESNGYQDKRNRTYRGAYQFDRATWASVGGVGDPADASPAEQDLRALMLFQHSGRTPWPNCGWRL